MVALVKIDQYNQLEAQMDWIAIEDALGELSVQKQTLYAYVSRGLLRAKRRGCCGTFSRRCPPGHISRT